MQVPQPSQVHRSSQVSVFLAQKAGQNGGGGGDSGGGAGGGSICGCDTTGHSVQPPQPFQVQRASQGWVFRAQKFLHKPGGDCESDCESSKTNGVCIAAV